MRGEKGNSLFYFPGNLVEVFKIRKRILGKVDLQKTVYFMKRLGVSIPFNFRWNILGPYSYDLAHHCDHLVIEGLFRYTGKYILNKEKAKTYVSNLKPQTKRRLESFFGEVEEICNADKYDFVYFIVCAASLDFILRNVSKKAKKKRMIYLLLNALKTEKAERFRRLRDDAWNLLVDEDLIQQRYG